ncbi:hypothetical protein HHK36_032264 [Tetracentron sinense]|uniref:Cytochrome P450 n=1 Tax=Tetracentron sinense TaxID=13715 RepID=A0A834Y7J9_TETSI|nr:hypothetical protein HHK36_032264 [Tetracentron sinense]
MMRKVCVREMLSNSSLDSSYALRRDEVRKTVRDVYTKIDTPINICELVFLTILEVVMSMLWGGTLGGEESSVRGEFREMSGKIVELLGKPNISDLFPILAPFDIQGVEGEMKKLLPWVDRIFDPIIDDRLKLNGEKGEQSSNHKGNKDLLQFLLQLNEQGDTERPLTKTEMKAILLDIAVGGTDTTSTTVEWVMAELMQHPEVMRRAQEELDDVVGVNNIVEESHLPKLQYLDAIVKETLRLHPALPLLVPHCPSLSCIVGGYTVPKGTRVFLNVWAMQRDPQVWNNPLEFQPERFLRDAGTCDYSGNNFNYLPFGSGRRICAGITLAQRMLMYVLASLLHSFLWQLHKDTELDLTEKFGIVLRKKDTTHCYPHTKII